MPTGYKKDGFYAGKVFQKGHIKYIDKNKL